MADSMTHPGERRVLRKRVIVAVIIILAIAAFVYVGFVRQHGPRHLKLALVTWTEDPFWQPLLRGAQDYADQSNIDLTVIRSKPTVDAQTQHLRELLDSGIDGIAVAPNDVAAEHAILDEATGKVPVVTFDTDAPDTKRRRYVGIDNYAAGRVCADEMREALPDGGPVLISVGSVTQQHGRDRRQGVIDGLLERGFDRNRQADPTDAPLKGPKFTVVATATDDGDPAKAVASITAALKAHPEVKGIFGLYSYSAPAALTAIKALNQAGKIQVVAFDEADETQAGLHDGSIHSSILQESYHGGSEAIRVLADAARGVAQGPAETSPILYVGINVMTDKNLDYLRKAGLIRQPADAPSTQPANP